jgi:hypothetical protein
VIAAQTNAIANRIQLRAFKPLSSAVEGRRQSATRAQRFRTTLTMLIAAKLNAKVE